MLKTMQTKCFTSASSETLLTMLEVLPGALFVLDDIATIVYANASAQAMLGAHQLVSTPEHISSSVCGRIRIDGVSAMLFHAQWKDMYPE